MIPAFQPTKTRFCAYAAVLFVLFFGAGRMRAQEAAQTDAIALDAVRRDYAAALDSWETQYLAQHKADIDAAQDALVNARANFNTIVEQRAQAITQAEAELTQVKADAEIKRTAQHEEVRKKLEYDANEPIRSFRDWQAGEGAKVVALISKATKNEMPYSVLADTNDPKAILDFVPEDSITGENTPSYIKTAVVVRPANLYFIHLKYEMTTYHDLWANVQEILGSVADRNLAVLRERDQRWSGIKDSLSAWDKEHPVTFSLSADAAKILHEREVASEAMKAALTAVNQYAPDGLETVFASTPQGQALRMKLDSAAFPSMVTITEAYVAETKIYGVNSFKVPLNPGEGYHTVGVTNGTLVILVGNDRVNIPIDKTDLIERIGALKKQGALATVVSAFEHSKESVSSNSSVGSPISMGELSPTKIDPRAWNARRPLHDSDVNFYPDHLELHRRGTIVSTADFKRSRVMGIGSFESSQDVFVIYLRANPECTNPFGAPDAGIVVQFDMIKRALLGYSWDFRGDGRQDLATASLPVGVGQAFKFLVVDNGSTVSVYLNDPSRPALEFECSRVFGSKIVLHNHESAPTFTLLALDVRSH
jgi:hypothetical protein